MDKKKNGIKNENNCALKLKQNENYCFGKYGEKKNEKLKATVVECSYVYLRATQDVSNSQIHKIFKCIRKNVCKR